MKKLKLPADHPYAEGRVCTTCGEFKPANEYTLERDTRAFGGVAMRSKCKPCNEFVKYKAFIKRTYGITYEDYTKMLEEQHFGCAICKSSINNNSRTSGKLFVDHCHDSKEVRGLLCSKCNHALGLFNDDVNLLANAISYLTSPHPILKGN